MFYCEIDKTGLCYHATENKLPLKDNVILSDENPTGKIYENGVWVDPPEPEEEPTQEVTSE